MTRRLCGNDQTTADGRGLFRLDGEAVGHRPTHATYSKLSPGGGCGPIRMFSPTSPKVHDSSSAVRPSVVPSFVAPSDYQFSPFTLLDQVTLDSI